MEQKVAKRLCLNSGLAILCLEISVNAAVNGTCFESGRDKAGEEKTWLCLPYAVPRIQ